MARQRRSFRRVRGLSLEGDFGAQELIKRVSEAFGPQYVKEALLPGAIIVRDRARANAPRGKRRLNSEKYAKEPLRDGIFAVRGRPNDPSVIIGVNIKRHPEATWVEWGTQPHRIPRIKASLKGKMLKIFGKIVSHVEHPGAKKHPFFRPALRQSAPEAIDAIKKGARDVLHKRVKLPENVEGQFTE